MSVYLALVAREPGDFDFFPDDFRLVADLGPGEPRLVADFGPGEPRLERPLRGEGDACLAARADITSFIS